jgi:hypothetical protein
MIPTMTSQPWTLSAIEVPGVRAERAQGVPSDAEGTAEVPA